MPCAGYEAHLGSHGAVGGLSLDCATGIVSVPAPLLNASRGIVDVAAQSALVGLRLVGHGTVSLKAVDMIGQELLRHVHIDLPFCLTHELFPTEVTSVGRGRFVAGIECGLFRSEERRVGKECRSR